MSYQTSQIEYMNSEEMCIVCFMKPEKKPSLFLVNKKPKMLQVPLEKHHVQYFPERIAFVHDHCHVEINKGEHPHLVQYAQGDSRIFYETKKGSN